tara:strand:+ start:2565 stop:3398 length:834 start_codon:yes stop_codon:yes gene_type:complete
MSEPRSNALDLITFCESAGRSTGNFLAALSEYEPGSDQWKTYLKSACNSENNLIQIVAFEEIGKSSDADWLPFLSEWLQPETFPTTLVAVINAMGALGGIQSRDDFATLIESADRNLRGAAICIHHYLPHDEAIDLLLSILYHDPDPDLRHRAALRLANLHSDAGLPLLLEGMHRENLFGKLTNACALAILNHPRGLHFLHDLIATHHTLSKQDRTRLLFHICGLGDQVGFELPPCDCPEDLPVETIFQNASDWIEGCSGFQKVVSMDSGNHITEFI